MKSTDERIRATVIGASQFTVQVSGNTISISDESVLPFHNLQVIYPHCPSVKTSRQTRCWKVSSEHSSDSTSWKVMYLLRWPSTGPALRVIRSCGTSQGHCQGAREHDRHETTSGAGLCQ